MIDQSIAFAVGILIGGNFALLLSIRSILKKENKFFHKKLDSLLEFNNIKYPNENVVSNIIDGIVLDGNNKKAIAQLIKETGCSKESAEEYVSDLKKRLSTKF